MYEAGGRWSGSVGGVGMYLCVCLCTGPVVGGLVVWVEWGCICVSVSMYGAGGSDLVVWVEWGCICVSVSMYGAGGG